MKFQIGDKVKVIDKSTGVSLENSHTYRNMKEKKQECVYVVGITGTNYICSIESDSDEYGEYFLEKDLVLYSEKDDSELLELKDMIHALQGRVEQLGKMCHDEFNKSDNKTFTYKDYKKLVQEAKEFVSDNLADLYVDENGFSLIYFKTNEGKRTVVALQKVIAFSKSKGKVVNRGVAKCIKDDLFQEDIGKAIALGRLLGKDVSKFTNI